MVVNNRYRAATAMSLLFFGTNFSAQKYQSLTQEQEKKEHAAELTSIAIQQPQVDRYALTQQWSCAVTRLEKIAMSPETFTECARCPITVAGTSLLVRPHNKQTIVVYDLATGNLTRTFNVKAYSTCAVSADGAYMALGEANTGTITMFDVTTGEQVVCFNAAMADYGKHQFSLYFSKDAQKLYALAQEPDIGGEPTYYGRKFDIATGNKEGIIPGETLPDGIYAPEFKKIDWYNKQKLVWSEHPNKLHSVCWLSHLFRYYGSIGMMVRFIGVTCKQEPVLLIEKDITVKDCIIADGLYVVKADEATQKAIQNLTPDQGAFVTKLETISYCNLGRLVLSKKECEKFSALSPVLQDTIKRNCRIYDVEKLSCTQKMELLCYYNRMCQLLSLGSVGSLLIGGFILAGWASQ